MEVHKTKSAVSKVRIVHGKKLADSNMAGHCRTDEHVEPWERFSTDFLRPKDDSSYSSLPPAYTSLPHLKSLYVITSFHAFLSSIHADSACPVLYALMPRKTRGLYKAVKNCEDKYLCPQFAPCTQWSTTKKRLCLLSKQFAGISSA